MSLSDHLDAAVDIAHELHASASAQEFGVVWAAVKQHGKEEWIHWLKAHAEEAAKFLRATPDEREKRPEWNKDGIRPFLTVAALLHAHNAVALLENAALLEQETDRPCRELTYAAALLVMAQPEYPANLWPWDEHLPWDEQ